MPSLTKFHTPGKIIRLGNAVTWLRNQQLQPLKLTATQSEAIFFILRRTRKKHTVTAIDLMEHLELSQSTVAGIIKRLESKSLICRSTDPDDSRRSIISPTDEGMKLDDAVRKSAARSEELILKGMSEAEQQEFNRLLRIALDNMLEYRNSKEAKADEK